MFSPSLLPFRAPGSCGRSHRTPARLIVAALLIPLLSSCDSADPIEVTPDADTAERRTGFGKLDRTSDAIQIPDPPQLLDVVGEFKPPRKGRSRGHEHRMRPAGWWLQELRKATTWDLAAEYSAMASLSIAGHPRGAQRQFYPRLFRLLEAKSDLSSLVTRPPKPTRADIVDFVGEDYAAVATICFVGFDLYSILDAFPDQAQSTFVVEPYWRQDCGSEGQVRVRPITTIHNHYHLLYEDPDINCFDLDDGMYGREVNGVCESLDDFAAEPRLLGSMGGDEIIRIRTHDPVSDDPVPFDLISFANVGDEPVKLRYQTMGGQWFQWNSLGGQTNWGLSVFDAVEVLITHAGTSLDCGPGTEAGAPGGCPVDLTPFLVDEFVIGL